MKHVSLISLIERINRRLRPQGRHLRITRGRDSVLRLGSYHISSYPNRRDEVFERDVLPVEVGRRMGLIMPWEAVEGEED